MKNRCIMIFPKFNNIEIINKIRKQYDPLFEKVQPHITLVFPFESCISSQELQKHIKYELSNTKPFELTLQNIIKVSNNTGHYLFLEVVDGEENLKVIHKNLYNGILETYKPLWLNDVDFKPHITLGCFKNNEELESAYESIKNIKNKFNTIVNKISIENIDKDDNSIIEMEINLTSL
ncbi:2'-5' RNA ligase superfamily [[Clostridium] sordellii]|uniref:2'-5' RNA ligase family protein n=1 Tax=Paraclostridium sordellii TaxID=1505 RepID=UPI0005E6F4EE|nr:2'-5' RNA ligase family protein [Paeniclostridium sordellii]CEN74858.1 2'-5' RNA ligase superfamily [[Clostridium] sordellii] [Paeniclostridium sordellii]